MCRMEIKPRTQDLVIHASKRNLSLAVSGDHTYLNWISVTDSQL